MMMPGRKYSIANTNYRYGFNGKEKSDEINGSGVDYDYGARILDARLGKFLSVDPLSKSYPMLTSYQFAGNRPICAIDLDGNEPKDVNTGVTIQFSEADAKELNKSGNKTYAQWKDLLTMPDNYSVMEQANKRFLIHTFSQQRLSTAASDELNIDYYSVTINKLPPAFKSAGAFFEHIRTHIGDFMNNGGASFEGYDKGETQKWSSSNPTSSIMRFNIIPLLFTEVDKADVITGKYSKKDMYWIFKPVYDATLFGTFGDLGHPVSGQRQFGLTDNGNGTYTFYTRGVDRPTNPIDSKFADKMVFPGADKLWRNTMNNFANQVNSTGGSAKVNESTIVSKRISYSKDVSSEDKQKIVSGGN